MDDKVYSLRVGDMIIEPATAAIPPEIAENIDTLHGKVETLQRELSQALEVWQSTLTEEKTKFGELLEHKQLAWQEQDGQWSRQTQVYEERLAEMKSEFEARLKQTDQAAVRALQELDDAWQRDKLEWGPVAKAEWPAKRKEFETKIEALEKRLSDLETTAIAERAALQARIHELEAQAAFQDSISLPAAEMAPTAEPTPISEPVPTPEPVTAATMATPDTFAVLQALDQQIAVLQELVYHVTASPSEPSATSDFGHP